MDKNLTMYLIETYHLDGLAKAAVIVAGVLLCMIVPYLLGSINFGLIISKNKFHDDIRAHGSGNAGTTNMLRTYGKRAAILTLVGDMLKAALAVGFGYLVADGSVDITNDATGEAIRFINHYGAAIAGLFVMMGHMFPIFFKFKGGKGVATSGMVILMISPISFVICFAIFVIIVVVMVVTLALFVIIVVMVMVAFALFLVIMVMVMVSLLVLKLVKLL